MNEAHSDYLEGDRVDLHFIFAKKPDSSSSNVKWFFQRRDNLEIIPVSSNISMRYKTTIQNILCPEYLAAPMNFSCQIASLSLIGAFFGDIGDYTAQVEGEDCSPCSTTFSINVIPKPT
ncbi:unnamed protein product [Rodentolepis nana]|uniref:CUB domain-containing protein n=1 Tax=Rodentolepis nana TaxID=102285 RepID=A0A0R3TA81_RODNA|nr:unnamed protein product [Rodentolepis nana]